MGIARYVFSLLQKDFPELVKRPAKPEEQIYSESTKIINRIFNINVTNVNKIGILASIKGGSAYVDSDSNSNQISHPIVKMGLGLDHQAKL
jgi:hypothetical protein